jgi:hypothetical protein
VRTCIIRTIRGDRATDRPVTYEQLERRFKRKLDRRRRYAVVHGELCEAGSWTEGCTGCNGFSGLYGSGCHECGYHGRVRVSMWLPVSVCDAMRKELSS